MKQLIIYSALLIFLLCSCDPADNRMTIINKYKNDLYFDAVLKKDSYYENLNLLNERWQSEGENVDFSIYGDTLNFSVIGDWNHMF